MVLALVAMLGVGRVVAGASQKSDDAQQVLRLSLDGTPPRGPAEASTGRAPAQAISGLLWDGLTGPPIRPGGDAVPALAESWSSNDDFSLWTFTLDESRTFSNGLLVDPHDVTASIRRSLLTGSGPVQRRLIQLLDGPPALAITADGSRSVEFRLSETFSGLPLLLSGPEFGVTSISAPRVGGALGGTQGMVTSGAYRVTSTTSTQWTLERAPTGGGRPGPDTVTIDWQAGASDSRAPSAEAEDGETTAASSKGDATIDDGQDAALTMGIHLNSRRRSFASAEDRRAVLGTLRADLLATTAFGPDAVSTTSLVPGDPGCDCVSATKPDTIELTTPKEGLVVLAQDTDASRRMANSVVAQLGAAGVSARAKPLTTDGYTVALGDGSYDLVVAGVSALSGSAPDVAQQLFASTGTLNYSGLANLRVDTLLVAATAAVGTDEATETWAQANDAIRDQAVVLPVVALSAGDAPGPGDDGLGVDADGSLDLTSMVFGEE